MPHTQKPNPIPTPSNPNPAQAQAPNFVPPVPPQVEAIPMTPAELDRILKTAKNKRVYPINELNREGSDAARHFTADMAEAAGLHAMAAELRGQHFDPGYVAGAKRWFNESLSPKKVLTIVVVAGVTYVAYSGLAWVFRFKGGVFGKRAAKLDAMQFPQPL